MRLLAQHGRLQIVSDLGRRVIARWKQQGESAPAEK